MSSSSSVVRGREGGVEGLRGGGGLDGSAPGEQCPWGASHRLSSDPGAPAEAEGAGVLWIHTGWADPLCPAPDSSRVPVGSCCCRRGPSSDPRTPPHWSRLSFFPPLGARVPLVSQPLPEAGDRLL